MSSTTPSRIWTTRRPSRSSAPRKSFSSSPGGPGRRRLSRLPGADERHRQCRGGVQEERRHRRPDRVCRSRQEAGRPAALRPGDPRRPAVDGQDRARASTSPSMRRPMRRSGRRPRAEDGRSTGFFSLEMSAEQLATRMLSPRSGVSSDDASAAAMQREDFESSGRRRASALQSRRSISTTPRALERSALRTRARRFTRQHGSRADRRRLPAVAAPLGAGARWKTGCRRLATLPAG